ncbi:MAG: hypothetical protein ACK4GK_14210 [Ferrovibrio sp.]|jgi:hypothetical protein
MSKAFLAFPVLLAALLCGLPTGRADETRPPIFNRNWTADSTTSMGITGDVKMTPESITFNNRITFRWRYIGDITPQPQGIGFDSFDRFSVYELIDAKPRAIKGGNHLCGHPKYTRDIPLPHYIAVSAYTGSLYDKLGMVVSSGEAPPKDALYVKGDFCGSFGYSDEKSKR